MMSPSLAKTVDGPKVSRPFAPTVTPWTVVFVAAKAVAAAPRARRRFLMLADANGMKQRAKFVCDASGIA